MDTPQIKKVEILEDAAAAFPMLMAVSKNKHAADEAVIEATLESVNNSQSPRSAKRRMMAAVSSRNTVAVNAAPPRLGAEPPLPYPNPPLPPLPPYAGPDGTVQGWDQNTGQYDETNFNNTGYLNGLYNILQTLRAHPTTAGFYSLLFYVNGLAEKGLMTPNVVQMLNLAGGQNLMKDALERTAFFAFYSGYTDAAGKKHAAGMDSYKAFLNDWNNTETQINTGYPNPFTQAAVDDLTVLLLPDNINAFQAKYVAANGDLIFPFGDSTFDFTAAVAAGDTNTQNTILSLISNEGITGDPSTDIQNLDGAFGQIQSLDLLATMDAVWKKYHDVGLMILAFMQGSDSTYLNQESGNADIMNQQHDLDKNYIQEIQSVVSTIGTWQISSTNPPTPEQLADVQKLMNAIPAVIAMINASGQFQELQGPIANFVANLQSSTGTWNNPTLSNPSVSLYQVLVLHNYKGTPITPTDAIQILHDMLTPTPPAVVPPTSGTNPSANPVPNTETLQGFISTITAISSAVSSSSTQLTTSTSQVEQMHQALLKVGTGVIDPKNGLMAINNNAVSHQVTN